MRRVLRDGLAVAAVTLGAGLFLKLFVLDACRIGSPSMEPTLLPGDYVVFDKVPFSGIFTRRFPLFSTSLPTTETTAASRLHIGDVVVFRYPGTFTDRSSAESPLFVKRCVGLPGDSVRITGTMVFVDSRAVTIPSLHGNGGTFGPSLVPAKGTRIMLDEKSLDHWRLLIEGEGHRVGMMGKDSILLDGVCAASYTVERDYLFVVGDNLNDSFDSRTWGPLDANRVVGKAVLLYWSQDPSDARNGFWQRLLHPRWSRIGTPIR